MDYVLSYLSGALGLDPETFLLVLGVVVALCNLAGRAIPDDAVGFLGFVRRVCKFLGLYLSNRVTGSLTTASVTKAVAERAVSVQERESGRFKPLDLRTTRSPMLVGIGAFLILLLVSACTTSQRDTARATVAAVCQSIPLAQSVIDTLSHSGRISQAQELLRTLDSQCPGVLLALELSEAAEHGVLTTPAN